MQKTSLSPARLREKLAKNKSPTNSVAQSTHTRTKPPLNQFGRASLTRSTNRRMVSLKSKIDSGKERLKGLEQSSRNEYASTTLPRADSREAREQQCSEPQTIQSSIQGYTLKSAQEQVRSLDRRFTDAGSTRPRRRNIPGFNSNK